MNVPTWTHPRPHPWTEQHQTDSLEALRLFYPAFPSTENPDVKSQEAREAVCFTWHRLQWPDVWPQHKGRAVKTCETCALAAAQHLRRWCFPEEN